MVVKCNNVKSLLLLPEYFFDLAVKNTSAFLLL